MIILQITRLAFGSSGFAKKSRGNRRNMRTSRRERRRKRFYDNRTSRGIMGCDIRIIR